MVDALKKLDKKYLIILGLMIFLPILLILILMIVNGCGNSKMTHEKYEEKMIEAAQKYVEEKDLLPKNESDLVTVELSDLVKGEYINSTEQALDDDSCKGYVTIRKNGSTVEANNGGFYNYLSNLECEDYETNTLIRSLMKDVTTTESGLYNQGNYYVYRGEKVNNYITFYGKKYRIMSIDSNGIVRLIKSESESLTERWDDKFNSEANNTYGKNIYKDSNMVDILLKVYNTPKLISEEAKKHIVSYNVCTDSRDVTDVSLTKKECSNVLENQPISILGVTEFAEASLDPECNAINSKMCRNYNYLQGLGLDTWTYTASSNTTYDVYYLNNGVIDYQDAGKYFDYHIVIYVDGNEVISSGNGTESSPYIIE